MLQTKCIYDFSEGSRDMRALLGGKGSGIAEMTRVLRPELVPAGFTITTEACVAYMRENRTPPPELDIDVRARELRIDGRVLHVARAGT
jgi:pyruvate, orthophosphate dikinase